MWRESKDAVRILLVFSTIGGVLGEFKFIAEKWNFRQVFEKRDETINCQTNDLNATVSLQVSNGAEYQNAEPVFGNRLSQNGQQFTLTVEKGDGRLFQCKATNSSGDTIVLQLGLLFVTPSPQQVNVYLIPDAKVQQVEQGGHFNITCETVGGGSPDIPHLTWYRDIQGTRQPVAKSMVDSYFSVKSRTKYEHLVLMIRNADQTITGTYTCVREESNVRTSKKIEIKLEAVTAPVVKLLDSTGAITVQERQGNVLVTCSVTGSPRPQRAWYFKGKVFAFCPDLTTDKCYLQIPKPTYGDQGIYSCVAKNLNGTASESVKLQVLVPVSLEKPGSKIYYGLHQTVDLYCIVKRANPLPRLTWRYQPYPCKVDEDCDPKGPWEPTHQGNQIIPAPDTPTNQSILKVGASEQSSFYSCLANNSISTDVYSFSLLRIENPPLQFSISPMNPKVNEHDEVSLTCNAQFNIFEETSWLKDGKSLSGTVNRTKQQTGSLWKDVLRLGRVQTSDEGNYTCIGKKRQGGTVLRHSFLKVEALRKPTIYSFVDQRAFEKNMSVVIRCNTSGNPDPVLKWRFNNQLFRATNLIDSSRCAVSTSGFYFIQGDKHRHLIICKPYYETHTGNYTCEANNTLGSVHKTKKLDIFAPPSIIGWDDMVRYVPTRELVLMCRTRGNPAPFIKWYKVSSEKVLVEIPMEGHSNSTAQVRIARYSQDAQGNYSCVAFNTLGMERRDLQVSIEDPLVKEAEKRVAVGIIASAVVVPVLAVLLLCLVYVMWYRRRLEKQYVSTLQTGKKFTLDPNKSLMEQSGNLPYDLAFEFPRERLNLLRTAGSGAYGQVWVAEAYGMARFKPRDRSAAASKERKRLQGRRRKTFVAAFQKERSKSTFFDEEGRDKMQVAVKMLKEEATDDELRDLASELKIMIHLGSHKNLVNLLGACTKTPELLIILEYCPHGNLLSFLKERRSIFEPDWYKLQKTMAEELTYIDLMQVAHGVSRGMEYLSLRKCIHRDLAARNILVSEDYSVKISDFGLARDVEKKDYYRKTTSGLLPIKWMAPESLFNQVYTDKTDVWSFGILLWEIFTLGGSPYPGVPASGLYEFLAEGGRMKLPDLCPETVFEVMMECWEEDPKDRPSFTYLLDRLEGVMHEYIKKEADILTPDGYMAPQDGPELQKLRESRRKFAKIRANPGKEELFPHSAGSDIDNSQGDSPQVARAVRNSYVELKTQDSISSNETCL